MELSSYGDGLLWGAGLLLHLLNQTAWFKLTDLSALIVQRQQLEYRTAGEVIVRAVGLLPKHWGCCHRSGAVASAVGLLPEQWGCCQRSSKLLKGLQHTTPLNTTLHATQHPTQHNTPRNTSLHSTFRSIALISHVNHFNGSTTRVMAKWLRNRAYAIVWYRAALTIVSPRCKDTSCAVTNLSSLKHPQPCLETQKPDI